MLKQAVLGSALGRIAFAARNFVERLRAPDEMLGCYLNDRLATFLATRLCGPGETFADVGAHIGSVIAEVRRWSPSAHVVAFEAMPDKAEALRRKFPDVTVHCRALAEDAGQARFFVDSAQSGYSSLADNGGNEIVVEKARMDELLDDADIIKIDVEGAELGVLRGAAALIARSRPTIMFESGPDEMLGYTKEALFDWFAEHEYGVFVPHRLVHTAPPLARECFLDSHFYPRRTTNYFGVAVERIEAVRERAIALTLKA